MQFTSFSFLLFLPLTALVSYLLPGRFRKYWLLAGSCFFYLSGDRKGAVLLFASCVITYTAARLMDNSSSRNGKKQILALSLLLHFGILYAAKYLNFTLASIFSAAGKEYHPLQMILPLGISFYTLAAGGYLIDVYRGKVRAERNFLTYALFVSFFPAVLSGPIERAGHLLPQFENPKSFDPDMVRDGALTMLFGYFMKLVLADRIRIVVDTVYQNPAAYQGTLVVLAVLFYSVQIYCDFAGYSSIAIGAAKILGIALMDNFDRPYLSGSIAQFWRRWHRSLSYWFRDYLYIPLGGSRKGQLRRYLNILIVFAVSGLWHGAGVTFLFWGFLHGMYQVTGYLLRPLRDKTVRLLHIDRSALSHRMLKVLVTFLLVSFAWIFFRSPDMQSAGTIIRSMRGFTPWIFTDGTLCQLGLDMNNMKLLWAGIAMLFLHDLLHLRGISLKESLARCGIWLRWPLMIALVLLVVVCGIWGPGYDASTFIYAQF